jgi:glycosyltransferase involved in cell wall biosynthesis
MKVTYVLTWADAVGGTERTVLSQAEYLAATNDVEVLSVFRTRGSRARESRAGASRTGDGRVRVRYLVDRTGAVARPERAAGYDDATCRALGTLPSTLIDPRWEPEFTRMTDIELELALRDIDADIVVTTSPVLLAQITALVPARVITVHQEHRVSELRGATGEPLYDRVPRLDALVTLSERSRDWFAETFGPAAPLLATIPNPLPPGFRPMSTLDSRTVVMAGRLVPEKQAHHAVEAFATVVLDHPGWILRIFGEGPQAGRLRRLIDALDLHDNVQLLGQTPNMAEEWAKAAIAVQPSRVEAFPLTLLEALAAGVPVVSYNCPNGPAEIVTHGTDGLLVAPDDVAELAAALGKLMNDDATRNAYGAMARRSAERFAAAQIMPRWADLYAQLLAERDDPGRSARKANRVAYWAARTGGSGFAPVAPVSEPPVSVPEASVLEARIQAADSTLVRSGGRLCRVTDTLMPLEATRVGLELVAEILERHGIPYFVLRDHGLRYRVAIEERHRTDVLAALAEDCADRPVYAEILRPGGRVDGVGLAATLPSLAGRTIGGAAGIRVFQPAVTSTRTLRYGAVYGCDLEFWARSADGAALVPLRPTMIGDVVPLGALEPARLQVGGRDYPSIRAFTRPLVADVTFPIDVVYTWVDNVDTRWRARRDAALPRHRGSRSEAEAAGDSRFRSRDELRYSLRSLEMYAPWIRHIWIVTDDQVPRWLNTAHPRLTVVDHREIFADRAWLPTYNSHAIETQLHHIDGLTEQFIYLNDDVFLGRPVLPNLFFEASGMAKFFRSPTPIPMTPLSADDDINFAAAKNNRRLVEETFGRTLTHSCLHAPHPLRRSVLAEIEDRFAADVARTAATRLRSRTDVAVPSSLHHYYGYFTGRSVPGVISSGYVNLRDRSQHPKLTRFLAMRSHDVLCLNDTHLGEAGEQELDLIVDAFLASYFPIRCEFERTAQDAMVMPPSKRPVQ